MCIGMQKKCPIWKTRKAPKAKSGLEGLGGAAEPQDEALQRQLLFQGVFQAVISISTEHLWDRQVCAAGAPKQPQMGELCCRRELTCYCPQISPSRWVSWISWILLGLSARGIPRKCSAIRWGLGHTEAWSSRVGELRVTNWDVEHSKGGFK